MGFIVYAIVILVFVWIIHRWNSREYVRLSYKVPSNKWNTFLAWGKIVRRKDFLIYMYETANKLGTNCVIWLGPWSLFLSTDPQTIKEILTSKNCINKPDAGYKGISSVFGESLITESEPHWSRHRKVLNKAFSAKTLNTFFPIFHKEINSVIEEIQRKLEKSEDINMFSIFRELTLKNSTKTALKRNLEQTEFNSVVMSKHVQGILEYAAEASVNPILGIKWVCKLAEISLFKTAGQGLEMFRKLIDQSVDILENNKITDPSYLHEVNSSLEYALMGVKQNNLGIEEIESLMMHLFFGAFETTSTTLYLVITLLAMHPHFQERVYEEIINILPSDNSEITLEVMDQLTYLDMVINETMRVLPVVPMVYRRVSNEELNLSNGLTLPVGQFICIDIYRLHRSKDLYGPHANTFSPDNFLPSNVAARHPFSFIPFTKGQRFCIGWRYAGIFLKISLAKLIKNFRFTTDFRFEDLIPENHISLKLKEEPRLNVEKREVPVN